MVFSFKLQHVTDLSGRETMVRITGIRMHFICNISVCHHHWYTFVFVCMIAHAFFVHRILVICVLLAIELHVDETAYLV